MGDNSAAAAICGFGSGATLMGALISIASNEAGLAAILTFLCCVNAGMAILNIVEED